mgnify:CR=1 FL=1
MNTAALARVNTKVLDPPTPEWLVFSSTNMTYRKDGEHGDEFEH